ncbi:MAG: type II toxin-antitoxin system VapB family antitoxin [Alphaproteobacteria bacterium]|nr:type II toxin-antitoxin system VapB family antitoxin [Alphaproteobacteria bacterium]
MGALNIKDKVVADKARRLAKLTGQSITAAVSEALDKSLKTAEHKKTIDRELREREVDEILKRFRASIPPDAPSLQQIMDDMYDENGLPK